MISKGLEKDLYSVLKITKVCDAAMAEQGIYQWNSYYPNRTAFTKDIEGHELYILLKNELIIGVCLFLHTWIKHN